MLLRHWMMTNMSSIPMPRQRKGRMACMGVYGRQSREETPRETTRPSKILQQKTLIDTHHDFQCKAKPCTLI